VNKRRKNSLPNQRIARRRQISKLLTSRKFKNNLRTSKRHPEIPRVRKTKPDLTLKLKDSEKLLMMQPRTLMIQPKSAKKLMQNLPKLLKRLPQRSRK